MNKYCNIQSDCKLITELEEKLDITSRQYAALQKKYSELLRLAKHSTNNYEYCISALEKEVEELRLLQTG